MKELLPKESFVKCHRSYLVNLKYVKIVNRNNLILENGVKIPISKVKYDEINDAFINYMI